MLSYANSVAATSFRFGPVSTALRHCGRLGKSVPHRDDSDALDRTCKVENRFSEYVSASVSDPARVTDA